MVVTRMRFAVAYPPKPLSTTFRSPNVGLAARKTPTSEPLHQLVGHCLRGRLALIENPHLDIARGLVGEILLAVNGSARNVIAVAGLQHLGRLALDGEGDFALLNRRPLVAGMAVELVACARRHGHGLHPHLARRVLLKWRCKIAIVLERRR